MALETRIEEVENDKEEELLTQYMSFFGWHLKSSQLIFDRTTKPVGAISYENLTYIHSETDTINFRRLVFERDLRMPNYKKIVELEEEFWILAECKTVERPLEPNPLMSFPKWVKINKPQTVSTGEKIIAFILSCLIFNALIGFITLLGATFQGWNLGSISYEEIARVFLLTPLPFSIPLSLLFTAVYSHIKSVVCLHNPNSKGYKKAQQQYHIYENAHESQLEAVRMYDYSVTRIPEILIEVNNLIE